MTLGYSTVAIAPSPAISGTVLTIASNDGELFPAVPFDATIWPAPPSAQPFPDASYAEIVRVTQIVDDQFTVIRAQNDTVEQVIVAGHRIAPTITAGSFGEAATVQENLNTLAATVAGLTDNDADAVNVVAVAGAAQTLAAVGTAVGNDLTLSDNLTVTMPTAVPGAKCYALIHTGAGSFTVAFTGVKWAASTAPTITASAAATDYFEFKSDGTDWYGTVVAQALG